jgi:hypothetical protein
MGKNEGREGKLDYSAPTEASESKSAKPAKKAIAA